MLESYPKILPIKKKAWYSDYRKYLDVSFQKKHVLIQSKLEFTNINKTKFNTRPDFVAFDTETYNSNGNLICLCNSKTDKVLMGSPEKLPDFQDYFDYFENLKMFPSTIFIAYNLKFDSEVILKSLGNKILTKFYKEDKFDGVYNGIKIRYIPKKHLSLRKGKTSLLFFDALQFFIGSGINGKTDLDSVAQKYLGEQKEYDGKYPDKNFPDKIIPSEMKKIITYCKQDCNLTVKIMNIWVDAFYKNFKFYPIKFYSCGFLTSQYFKTKLLTPLRFTNTPYPIQNLAYQSYFGGRFEPFERGYFENIHNNDIKSAYPKAMSVIPDMRNGKWKRLINIKDIFDCDMGFFKIKVQINETNISPFMLRQVNGLVVCPVGEIITHCTLHELLNALEYYDIKIKMISGYIFKSNSSEPTEFNKLIMEMYKKRMLQTNEGQKYIYKVLVNSGYGKFAQSKPEPRGLFNPVICSYITGYCRGMLLDAIKDNKEDVIMIATDGIFSHKKLNVKIGKKLGNYDYSFHPKMIMLMAGIYATNTEQKPKLKYHSRGFGLTIYEDNLKKQFNFDELKLKFDNDKFYYSILNQRPLSLVQSVIQKKYSSKLISKMIKVKKEININGDNKRIWLGKLTNVYDHNYSIPIEG